MLGVYLNIPISPTWLMIMHMFLYIITVFFYTTDLEEVIECTDEIVIVIFDEEHDGIRFPDELVAF